MAGQIGMPVDVQRSHAGSSCVDGWVKDHMHAKRVQNVHSFADFTGGLAPFEVNDEVQPGAWGERQLSLHPSEKCG